MSLVSRETPSGAGAAHTRVLFHVKRLSELEADGTHSPQRSLREISAAEAQDILREAPGIMLIDKREDGGYVTPIECVGDGRFFTCRAPAPLAALLDGLIS